WEPLGTAMVVEAEATLDAQNRIASWRYDVWSPSHNGRPVTGGGLLRADPQADSDAGGRRRPQRRADISNSGGPGDIALHLQLAGPRLRPALARRLHERLFDREPDGRAGPGRRRRSGGLPP